MVDVVVRFVALEEYAIVPKDVAFDVALDVEDLDLHVAYGAWVVNAALDVVAVVLGARDDLDVAVASLVVVAVVAVVVAHSKEFADVSNVSCACIAVFLDVATLAESVRLFFDVISAVLNVVLTVNVVAAIVDVAVLVRKHDVDVDVDVFENVDQADAYAVSSAKEDYRSDSSVVLDQLLSSRNDLTSELVSNTFALSNVANVCISGGKRSGSQ